METRIRVNSNTATRWHCGSDEDYTNEKEKNPREENNQLLGREKNALNKSIMTKSDSRIDVRKDVHT